MRAAAVALPVALALAGGIWWISGGGGDPGPPGATRETPSSAGGALVAGTGVGTAGTDREPARSGSSAPYEPDGERGGSSGRGGPTDPVESVAGPAVDAASGGGMPARAEDTSAFRGRSLLAGAQLRAALETALRDDDLAAVQGLLISSLTVDGTRFGADDLPLLFDALGRLDEFGLESLALAHLARVDAPPDELARGYLDALAAGDAPDQDGAILRRLVELGGDDVVLGLADLLGNTRTSRLGRRLATALGELGDARAVAPLEDAIRRAANGPRGLRGADPYLRALAQLGGDEATESLLGFVAGDDAAVRKILPTITNPDSAPALARALGRENSAALQRAIVGRLGVLGDARAVPALEQLLERTEGRLRSEVFQALGRIVDPASASALRRFAIAHPAGREVRLALRQAERIERRLAREREPR